MKRSFSPNQNISFQDSSTSKPNKLKLSNDDDVEYEQNSKIELFKNLKPAYVTINKLTSIDFKKYKINLKNNPEVDKWVDIIINFDLNSSYNKPEKKEYETKEFEKINCDPIEIIDLSSEDETISDKVVSSNDLDKLKSNLSLSKNKLNGIEKAYAIENAFKVAEDEFDEFKSKDETENKSEDENDELSQDEQEMDISLLDKEVNLNSNKTKSSNLMLETYYCIFCSRKTLLGLEKARIHYQHHLDCYLYKCSLCLEVITDSGSLLKHYLLYHSSKKKAEFKKLRCTSTLDWINNFLESQVQTNLQKRSFRRHCPVCQACDSEEDMKVFTNSMNVKLLYTHIFKHLHYKPFVCIFCEKIKKKFSTHFIDNNAYEHVLRLHPEHADVPLLEIFRQSNIKFLDLFIKTFLSTFNIKFSFNLPKTIPNFFKNRFFEKLQKKQDQMNKSSISKTKDLNLLNSQQPLLNQVSPNVNSSNCLINNTNGLSSSHSSLSTPNKLSVLNRLTEMQLQVQKVDENKKLNGSLLDFQYPLNHNQSQTSININPFLTAKVAISPIKRLSVPKATVIQPKELPVETKITKSCDSVTAHFKQAFDKIKTQEAKTDIKAANLFLKQNVMFSKFPISPKLFPTSSKISETQSFLNNNSLFSNFGFSNPDLISIQPDLPDQEIIVQEKDFGTFFCIFCSEKINFQTRIDVSFHFAKHLNYKPLICLLCSQKFSEFDSLMSHFICKHKHEYVCSGKSCDTLLYYARQDAKIERWIDEYILFQNSGKVFELSFFEYRSFCLLCSKFSENDLSKQTLITDQDIIYEHIYTHFNYYPFRCLICKSKNITTSISWLGKLAQAHLSTHGYQNISKPFLQMFFYYDPIIQLESLIKEYLITKYYSVAVLEQKASPIDNKEQTSKTTAILTSDCSKKKSKVPFTRTKIKDLTTINSNANDGHEILICYHCRRVLPTKKHLKDHHLNAHPTLSIVAYTVC